MIQYNICFKNKNKDFIIELTQFYYEYFPKTNIIIK